jgi:RNA polymerase sigma-70 factor (ECF subfamily)
MTDEGGLAAAITADLDGSYEKVVLTFQDRLYAFALRLCGDRRDAEEVTQDAFVRAHRALQRYAPDRRRSLALRAWLYRITLNLARNRMRARRRNVVSLDGIEQWAPDDSPGSRPGARMEERERRAQVAQALAGLPDRYRVPVILRHVDGLPYTEVASVLGQPVGTAKANVHRGVERLRRDLERRDDEHAGSRPGRRGERT